MLVINKNKILFLAIKTCPIYQYENLPKVLSIDWDRESKYIANEQNLSKKEIYDKFASYNSNFAKVILISLAKWEDDNIVVKNYHGSDKLSRFGKDIRHISLKQYDILAYNGFTFEYPFLAQRMLMNKIRIPEVLNLFGLNIWQYPKRLLDLHNWFSCGNHKNKYSLLSLCNNFGLNIENYNILQQDCINEFYFNKKENSFKAIVQSNIIELQLLVKLLLIINRKNINFNITYK